MRILCVFGEHNYGNPERGLSYEYANFLPALLRLGHETIFFESWNKSSYDNFAELNKQFLITVDKEQPEIVFCITMGCELWSESLILAQNYSNAMFIHWATDDSWKYEQSTRLMAPFFDLCTTTYTSAFNKAFKDGFEHFVLTQWAANSAVMFSPLPAAACQYEVSFIGTAYGNRIKWVKELETKGIKVSCFGHGWPHGSVSAEEIPQIIRKSKISLNFGDSGIVIKNFLPVRSRQIKARVFEVPGAGGFLMSEPADELEKFYSLDKEIIIFNGIEELSTKIKYFLSHEEERNLVANAGYERTKNFHTYEHRFDLIFKCAAEQRRNRKSSRQKFNLESFFVLEEQHKLTLTLKLIRFIFLVPCVLLFGKHRGPRAARRILYELSWRLFGVKTYSSKSWVGRMFYKES